LLPGNTNSSTNAFSPARVRSNTQGTTFANTLPPLNFTARLPAQPSVPATVQQSIQLAQPFNSTNVSRGMPNIAAKNIEPVHQHLYIELHRCVDAADAA
jgi:hypothetical protein